MQSNGPPTVEAYDESEHLAQGAMRSYEAYVGLPAGLHAEHRRQFGVDVALKLR